MAPLMADELRTLSVFIDRLATSIASSFASPTATDTVAAPSASAPSIFMLLLIELRLCSPKVSCGGRTSTDACDGTIDGGRCVGLDCCGS